MEEIEASGFGPYYIDHTTALWPQAAGGIPFNACEFQSKGDIITDLTEDMAAEQKARTTYDNILRTVKDSDRGGSPSASCGRGRSSIFSGSGKPSVWYRSVWIPKTSMPLIRNLINAKTEAAGNRFSRGCHPAALLIFSGGSRRCAAALRTFISDKRRSCR